MHDEFAKIAWLRQRFKKGTVPFSEAVVGIGDDAAVFDFGRGPTVVTVDTQVEGVHFRRDLISCRELGCRALISAASDVWAMASKPSAAVLALTLPNDFADADFRELIEGVAEAAEAIGAQIIGGNLSSGGSLSITTTVFGSPHEEAITRDGAQPGDRIYVTGELGAASLGLAVLQAEALALDHAQRFIGRWRLPPIHDRIVDELARIATASIDVSDGLLQDLGHVCSASGVGAMVRVGDVPTAEGHHALCGDLGLDPIELALAGGEDYELLFTTSPDAEVRVPATQIGTITEDSEARVLDDEGQPIVIARSGFDHFS